MDKSYYINLKTKDPSTGRKRGDGKRAKKDATFISESYDMGHGLIKHVRDNQSLLEAADWILGFNMYASDKQGGYVGKYSSTPSFGRGRIIDFDSFGHIGTEQKKNRPAIVLKESADGAIIAPIGKAAFSSGKPYHVPLNKGIMAEGNMRYDCGIKLEQLRYIDKARVTGLYKKVSGVSKLNEIDEKLLSYLSPNLHQDYEKLKSDNAVLEIGVNQFEQRVTELEKDVEEKDKEIQQLERKFQLLNQELQQIKIKDGA